MVFLHATADRPAEVYKAGRDGSDLTQLTHHNKPLLESLDVHPAEKFTFKGADGDNVAGWLIRPAGVQIGRKNTPCCS